VTERKSQIKLSDMLSLKERTVLFVYNSCTENVWYYEK